MPTLVAGSASAAAERTAAKLDAIRSRMPISNSKAERVEAKYDVVLDYPNLELHSAAASGNVGLVQYALTHGQPVNSLLHGCLPLHAASSGGNVSVVRMLIERGADVNAPRLPRRYSDNKRSSNMPAVGTAGSTPLHFAAANGHSAVVQLLLVCGAVADKPDKNGMSPEDLAELSGHTQVVHTIRVWRQMSHDALQPTLIAAGSERGADSQATAGPSRPRRGGGDSPRSGSRAGSDADDSSRSASTATPTGTPNDALSLPVSAASAALSSIKGKERAQTVATTASEKGMSIIRSSFDGVRGPIKNVLSRTQPMSPSHHSRSYSEPKTPPQPPSTPQQRPEPPKAPQLMITTSTPPHQENGRENGGGESSPLTPPFLDSPISGDGQDDGGVPSSRILPLTDTESSPDTDPTAYRHQTSRRPSLPSIIEKATHPGGPFRAPIQNQKAEQESSSSIAQRLSTSSASSASHISNGNASTAGSSSFLRGRGRNLDRRINKQAILGLFRRGASPHSRSPSPPRKTEATPPMDSTQVDENVAKLKRASMDPDLMRMALDVAQLSEQLEANATVSAPVTTTRFFEEPPPRNSSLANLSSNPPPFDRPWERRKGSGVISPSPLAREWSLDGDSSLPGGSIRRTRTEVRKVTPTSHRARRMPSEPHMAGAIARRRSMAGIGVRAVSDPASLVSTPASESQTHLPLPSSTDVAEDQPGDVIHDAMPSIQALAASRAQDESTPEETEEEGSLSAAPSAADVPALTLDVPDGSEMTWTSEPKEIDDPNRDPNRRRFRGESIGSATTSSSRGLRTPPSAQVTPPCAGSALSSSTEDIANPAVTASPRGKPRGTRSRGHSEASMTLGPGFPPVPEHETAEVCPRPPLPVRRISTHAEARDALQQNEQDVLALAQMPMTADSSRSLADQLAAYGDSHAIAEQFARGERMSSLGSGSERNSVASSESAAARKRQPSFSANRISRIGSTSPTRHYSGSVPSISEIYGNKSGVNDIYDRRDKAHRERLAALQSTPIYGMRSTVYRSRSVSGEYVGRKHASPTSDSWLNAGPNAALPPPALSRQPPLRNLTEPSASMEPTESNPHISAPLPIVSDPQALRTQKQRSRSALSNHRPQISSIKHYAPSIASLPAARLSGLGRSVSLNLRTPHENPNLVRYQGLAAARHYAEESAQAAKFGQARAHMSGDGHGSDDEDERDRQYTMIANDWRGGYVVDDPPAATDKTAASSMPVGVGLPSGPGRWGQIKGVLGGLRKQ